ncbi:hypothetical protein C7M84_005442 [Penaeus vannamei]|uniref:Uncharacterized protein n=1 Tax=Penaeus vannamei TaxID=6689 RepID=A0A3R7N352_PENVA|nr:hypothetical protein C7M84_005442 [Penaeus vannamei]
MSCPDETTINLEARDPAEDTPSSAIRKGVISKQTARPGDRKDGKTRPGRLQGPARRPGGGRTAKILAGAFRSEEDPGGRGRAGGGAGRTEQEEEDVRSSLRPPRRAAHHQEADPLPPVLLQPHLLFQAKVNKTPKRNAATTPPAWRRRPSCRRRSRRCFQDSNPVPISVLLL